MRRRLVALGALAIGLAIVPVAGAHHWPLAGGSASRSSNAAVAPGRAPVVSVWSAADGSVRTPVVITGGGGPDVQRVAYGVVGPAQLRIRVLGSGAPVGPPEGINVDDGSLNQDNDVFGTFGAVGFADTSTEDRLGQLLVVHNDDAALARKVYIARVRLDTGAIVSDDVVPSGTSECGIESSPLLTPTSPGGRILYFTITCNRAPNGSGLNRYLVRQPLVGDTTTPSFTYGPPGFAPITNATEVASPSLVVLRDSAGTPRQHVAVPRTGGIDFFSAEDPLLPSVGAAAHPPSLTASLQAAGESPQTLAAPSTAGGELAGGEGSGTAAAPALYVAANADGNTKVYRFVQAGNEAALRTDRVVSLPDSGPPAPGMALAETVGPSGLSAGGTLVVTSQRNATLLRTADLVPVRQAAEGPLPSGQGFGRTVAAISGEHAYLVRDGSASTVPEQLVLHLDGLTALAPPTFARADDRTAGGAVGQPAVARGRIVFGTAAGPFAYRTTDSDAPVVKLLAPAADAELSGTVRVAAQATDPGGVESVTFRLSAEGGSARVIGRVTEPEPGGSFHYAMQFPSASVANGAYVLEAVATDPAGNSSTSERRRIRVNNSGTVGSLPRGACANALTGSDGADRIVGSAAGDRILGGKGPDRLDGAGGHDCVLGQAGDDVLSGGAGDDLLEGAAGDDVLAGGTGRNRLDGGSGDDVMRGGRGRDQLTGGRGNDTMLGGAGADRLSGGPGRDTLRGERGNDRLSGGSGNDNITAGSGSNRIDGGSGNDRISAVNGRRDVITCGKGRDRVTADRRDRVSRTCERVSRRGK